jgi:C4-dicarboxylate transporter DctM subunit
MSPIEIALLCLIGALILMFARLPIAFSFGITGLIGLVVIKGFGPAFGILARTPYMYTSMEPLLPLPLFILMGFFVFYSGIGEDLFNMAYKWIGSFPGGIAYAATLSCTGFAACTGDSMASAAAMGSISLPSMKRFKYDSSLSTACIAAGGSLGILIPPSGPLIVYGYFSQTSVGALFISGILPGIFLSLLFLATIFIWCKAKPSLAPRGESFTLSEKLVSLKGVWPMMLIFILIIGGLYIGIFTPSEAGSVGALGAFIIGIAKRQLSINRIKQSLKDSSEIICFIFTILIGSMIFNRLLAVSGASTLIYEFLLGLTMPPIVIMIGIMFAYIILGMFLDAAAVMMLTLPIVIPIVDGLGFNLIWFGIVHVIVMELALVTPPVGLNLFVIQGVSKVPFSKIAKGIYPFALAMVLCLAFITIFPDIVLLLPSTMK